MLYTDGVTDAMDDDGNFFEEERLVELVRRHRDMAPAALVQTLIETVTRFSGKVQEDDLTVVIAKERKRRYLTFCPFVSASTRCSSAGSFPWSAII